MSLKLKLGEDFMKKYVRLSVEKSNIKSNVKKEATYFARVCKKGKIGREGLIKMVKEKAPYIDANSFEVGLEVLIGAILECVEIGVDVDLFGLGTVGLKSKGSLKVNKEMQKSLDGIFKKRDESVAEATAEEEMDESYEKELSQIAKKDVEFSIQFSPSRIVKKHIKENVAPSFINIKVKKPKIKSIEKVYSGDGKKAPSIIKIKGEDLKIVGNGGLYMKAYGKVIQIPKEAIIQNEPKTLMFLTNLPLKDDEKYLLHLSTQYAKMGSRKTSIIRRCVKEFRFERKDNLVAKKVC